MRESLKTDHPLATAQQIQALFSSIETIYNFNCTLLAQLDYRMSDWPAKPKIGTIPHLVLF